MKSRTKQTIDDYVRHGLVPGSFVTAVLSNDLMSAVANADTHNKRDLHEICEYVWNTVPMTAYGSPQNVSSWLKRKAEERKNERDG